MKSMKNLVVIISLICTFHVHDAYAQTNPGGKQINAITTAVPLYEKIIKFSNDAGSEKTKVNVREVDAKIVIQRKGLDIKDIKVRTGTYDTKYNARVSKKRTKPKSGLLAQFKVKGHPAGPYFVNFREVIPKQSHREGRQKNRRVEMTIVFE